MYMYWGMRNLFCACVVRQGTYARFTLADPTPRLCPDAVGSANANEFPTQHRLLGPHREVVGRSGAERVQCNCLSEGVVINKTPSRTNRRECTHCAPFGQCEWGLDATSDVFVPIHLRLHRRPIRASDRLM